MKYILKLLSISYFLVVFYITFLAQRRNGNTDYRSLANFDPSNKIKTFRYFDSISQANKYAFLEDFLGNIFLFIPVIPALIFLFEIKFTYFQAIILSMCLSCLIESMQFTFNRGVFDIFDIILNMVGGCLGIFVYKIGVWIKSK
jgi:glycopeptide antibiotics resistance protein